MGFLPILVLQIGCFPRLWVADDTATETATETATVTETGRIVVVDTGCGDTGCVVDADGDGAWSWRVVSTIAEDGSTTAPSSCSTASSATTWQRLDIADFCDVTADAWCRTGVAASDGCGDTLSGGIIRVDYDSSNVSITPYE